MKFTAPAVAAALSAPALASAYSFGPLFSPTPSFRLATGSPCRNSDMRAIVSDVATTHQQMRSDAVAARQQMKNVFQQPGYQMFDNGEQFQISLDVPGVKASDIKVDLEEGGKVLSLSGSREMLREGGTYSSSFFRRFSLDPSLDTDNLTANLQNGVLTVSAPKDLKKTEVVIKSIPVSENATEEEGCNDSTMQTSEESIHPSEENSDTILNNIPNEKEEDDAEQETIDLDNSEK